MTPAEESRDHWVAQYRSAVRRCRETVRKCRRQEALLDNQIEQNRLLLDERDAHRNEIRQLKGWMKEQIHQTVELLSVLAPDTARIEDRVALSCGIGDAFGLEPSELEILEAAARLADFGQLLFKEGESALEDGALRLPDDRSFHAGASRLLSVRGFSGVSRLLHQVPERMDGTGPKRVKGSRIPFGARILSAVWTLFANLESDADPVLAEMEADCGFDPAVLAEIRVQGPSLGLFSGDGRIRVRIPDLEAGMELASPIHARAGAMLLPEGTRLTAEHLGKIAAYSGAGPLVDTVFIKSS